jgi:hydrogenase/urease accessory protein HupE
MELTHMVHAVGARALRSPALHFLLIGGLLFVGVGRREATGASERTRLRIPRSLVELARRQFAEGNRRQPTPDEDRALAENLVEEEILYQYALRVGLDRQPVVERRLAQIADFVEQNPHETSSLVARASEARALGLQQGDPVVRRVLIDGAKRLIRAAVRVRAPTEAMLETYLRHNQDRFMVPVRTRITQVTINRLAHGPATEAHAQALMEKVRSGRYSPEAAPALGDEGFAPASLPPLTDRDLEWPPPRLRERARRAVPPSPVRDQDAGSAAPRGRAGRRVARLPAAAAPGRVRHRRSRSIHLKARWRMARLKHLVLVAAVLAAAPAEAHLFAPSLLDLREVSPGRATVRWKQPLMRVMGSALRPVLPGDCAGIGKPTVHREGAGIEATWEIQCPGGLVGRAVGVEGIPSSRADVLLRVQLADGRSLQHVLTGDGPTFTVPASQGTASVLRSYVRLGVKHILTGVDHLLFVLGLTLLVGIGRRLLWTITAFTVGHSITLGLAVLGFVHVPPAPIEAAIAFSIFVLAVEIARPGGRKGLLQSRPWFMSGLFGLLHGFGFAGALAEVGLPKGEIPLALFSFNAGIELGQIAFVGVVLAVRMLLRRVPFTERKLARLAPAYAIGSLGAFWLLERSWTALQVLHRG